MFSSSMKNGHLHDSNELFNSPKKKEIYQHLILQFYRVCQSPVTLLSCPDVKPRYSISDLEIL